MRRGTCHLKKPGRQLCERARQSSEIEGFDEMLRRADLSCRARSEESAQLVMHRLTTVLRHRLKASERVKLALSLEHALYGLGSQRSEQLVLEVRDAREEADRFKGLVGGDRDRHVSERATDMLLVSDVVHAAELGTWVCTHELRKQLWEVRYAMGRPDLDMKRVKVATDEVGERANGPGIAVSLNEYERTNRCLGSHAGIGKDVTPNLLSCALEGRRLSNDELGVT